MRWELWLEVSQLLNWMTFEVLVTNVEKLCRSAMIIDGWLFEKIASIREKNQNIYNLFPQILFKFVNWSRWFDEVLCENHSCERVENNFLNKNSLGREKTWINTPTRVDTCCHNGFNKTFSKSFLKNKYLKCSWKTLPVVQPFIWRTAFYCWHRNEIGRKHPEILAKEFPGRTKQYSKYSKCLPLLRNNFYSRRL